MKKNKSKRYDFRAPLELLNKLTSFFELDSSQVTEAVHNAINLIILYPNPYKDEYLWLSQEKIAPFIHPYDKTYIRKKRKNNLNTDDDIHLYDKMIQVSFREDIAKLDFLCFYYRKAKDLSDSISKIYEKASPTDAIRYAIFDVLNIPFFTYVKHELKKSENQYEIEYIMDRAKRIVPYPGQKNNKILEKVTSVCNEIITSNKIQNYFEPFMGSANVFLHLNSFSPKVKIEEYSYNIVSNFYLNDIDYNMVCLINTVRDKLIDFKVAYQQLEYNKDTFLQARYRYESQKNESPKTYPPLQRAVDLFILLHFSCRAKKKNFINVKKENSSDKSYECILESTWARKLLPLDDIHYFLKRANISCKDAFEFMDEHLSDTDSLYYVDSPYFFSEDFYDHCQANPTTIDSKELFPHEKLADALHRIHMSGNYFVASNRVTVSDTRKKYHGLQNKDAIDKTNQLYSKKGYYYQLHLFKDKENKNESQVEIIISNYKSSKLKPYNQDITEAEVNTIINSDNLQ